MNKFELTPENAEFIAKQKASPEIEARVEQLFKILKEKGITKLSELSPDAIAELAKHEGNLDLSGHTEITPEIEAALEKKFQENAES